MSPIENCGACGGPHMTGIELDGAKAAILARGRASAIVVQMALGCGYRRACLILDRLTEEGALGPDSPNGDGSREIRFK